MSKWKWASQLKNNPNKLISKINISNDQNNINDTKYRYGFKVTINFKEDIKFYQ